MPEIPIDPENPLEPASPHPKSGYTLPVFACAGAIAALRHLQNLTKSTPPEPLAERAPLTTVTLNLINPPAVVEIPIEQLACLSANAALAVTRSEPGDNLDLTRHTPIWSLVRWASASQSEPIVLAGGEGIGRIGSIDGEAAIYSYAKKLFAANLTPLLKPGERIQVSVILPAGKQLAQRTSNAAFGVVEGLSLLGTHGISEPLSAPGQLAIAREQLQQKAETYRDLVFCLGENGLDLALSLGVEAERRLKCANWLGPLLVEAGILGVRSVLIFGYHGKLIKLAGGIFHTHHHVADGRQEILAACCIEAGLETAVVAQVLGSATAEAALGILERIEPERPGFWRDRVYRIVAERIDRRSHHYLQSHLSPGQSALPSAEIRIGSLLFNRQRQIIVKSQAGENLLPQVCYCN